MQRSSSHPEAEQTIFIATTASRSSHGATGPHPHHHLRHLLTRRQRPAFPLSLYTSPHLVVCGLFSCVVALSSGTIPEQCHPHGWRVSAPLISAGFNMERSTASQSLMSVLVAQISQWPQLMQPLRNPS